MLILASGSLSLLRVKVLSSATLNTRQTMDEWTEDELYEMERATFEGVTLGSCNSCGHEQEIEPDGDYPCPECGKGRLQSVLMKYGMI